MPEIVLYGISNCDTVRKARRALDTAGVAFCFVDFRKDGLDAERLQHWIDRVGWETLINRRGTTWRQLPEEERTALDRDRAGALMHTHPTLIKRPVIEYGEQIHVGWNSDILAALESPGSADRSHAE